MTGLAGCKWKEHKLTKSQRHAAVDDGVIELGLCANESAPMNGTRVWSWLVGLTIDGEVFLLFFCGGLGYYFLRCMRLLARNVKIWQRTDDLARTSALTGLSVYIALIKVTRDKICHQF